MALSELEGVKVNDVAEALDIHPFMLSRWRKEVREGKIKGRTSLPPEAKAVKKQHEEMDAFARSSARTPCSRRSMNS